MSTNLFEEAGLPLAGQYLVLARKYRPKVFTDMIGQDVLVQTFDNAVKSNRIAHAFLLTGIRGVGKTTTARIIARALNCVGEDGSGGITTHPCGKCYHCISITEDRSQDVIEIDAASHTGVDDMREIIENARYKPINGRFKVYIIDEVHMLSGSAFNALLKTLEEPPMHVKFIFATTELRKIPMTILSRCQRFDLRRVEVEELLIHFKKILSTEHVEFDEESLKMIAKAAGGSVRDGLSILDQAISHTNGHLTAHSVREMLGLSSVDDLYDLYQGLLENKVSLALDIIKKLYSYGADPALLVQDLLNITHTLTKIKVDSTLLQTLPETEYIRIKQMLHELDLLRLNRMWMVLLKGYEEVRGSYNPLASLEMLIIRLLNISNLPEPEKLVQQFYSAAQSNVSSEGVVRAESSKPQQTVLAKVSSWEEVAALLLAKEEMMLYHQVRSNMQLVSFEVGNISVQLLNNTPKSVLELLKRFLLKATQQVWQIACAENVENPNRTLAQQCRDEKQERLEAVTKHPDVQQMLKSFTGLEIADIKLG